MQTWQDILAIAVVGTERQEAALAPAMDELGQLLAQIKSTDREEWLLSAAALTALYRRAGSQAPGDPQPLAEACETDEANRCRTTAGQHLALMLAGEYKEVLPEWLTALARVGQRVPEEFLPAILDKGRAEPSLRGLILPVLGKRGRWLAAQNTNWRFAAVQAETDVWETGSRDERLLLLQRLRATSPASARELLLSTWKKEAAKDRNAFLEILRTGLSGEDEEFLNEAQGDRSAEVRRLARALLTRLPGSQLCQRVKESAGQLLTFKKPILGRARIEVSMPDDLEAWLKNNKLDIELPARNSVPRALGPKGWCLQEMIGLIPATHWSVQWARTPDEIIKAALESEWKEALLTGFTNAVQRHPDQLWIEAIIADRLQQKGQRELSPGWAELAVSLPAHRLEALIFGLLKSEAQGLYDQHPALWLLLEHRTRWSDELSRAVVESVKRRINSSRKGETGSWHVKPALKQFAQHIAPAVCDELATNWPREADDWQQWENSVEAFLSLLSFRRDMLKAIFAGLTPAGA